MRKSMAYLMHVDWDWIKQRPHFLAEELSENLDVDLFYIRNFKNKSSTSNENTGKWRSKRQLTKFPYSSRFSFLHSIERLINRNGLNKLYSEQYDYIWITSPIVLQFIDLERISGSTIIYDCMDDILAFPQSRLSSVYLESLERTLLDKSRIVFVSSLSLRDKLKMRGTIAGIHVVNNAVSARVLKTCSADRKSEEPVMGSYSIYYFGTVASWIDFELLMGLLERHADVEIKLVGPIETQIPVHERLHAVGPVEHAKLIDYVAPANAFIMPFIVNELISSVDPVKVYEYIALGKPSFVVRYPETMKFEPYVYLYNGLEELSHLLTRVTRSNETKSTIEDCKEFLMKNTWRSRAAQILDTLNETSGTRCDDE